MMQAIRHVFEQAPATISIPEQWQKKPMEVILLIQEEEDGPQIPPIPVVNAGWPADYFEQTFGSIPDLTDLRFQGVAEVRELPLT